MLKLHLPRQSFHWIFFYHFQNKTHVSNHLTILSIDKVSENKDIVPWEIPALLPCLSPPGIELVPYSFSSLKPLGNASLSAIQELFLPPSLKISSCSLIVLCTSVQRTCYIMLTSCYIMGCSTPGFPVHHQLPELAQTHLHQVVDATQQFHLLSSPLPPAFNLFQHRGLF